MFQKLCHIPKTNKQKLQKVAALGLCAQRCVKSRCNGVKSYIRLEKISSNCGMPF